MPNTWTRSFSSQFENGVVDARIVLSSDHEQINGHNLDHIARRLTKMVNAKLLPALSFIVENAKHVGIPTQDELWAYTETTTLKFFGCDLEINVVARLEVEIDETIIGAAINEIVLPEVLKRASDHLTHAVRMTLDEDTKYTYGLSDFKDGSPQGGGPGAIPLPMELLAGLVR